MSHILRLMGEQEACRLEKVAGMTNSLLIKVATALMAKEADGGDDSALSFPGNPLLAGLKEKLVTTMSAAEMPAIKESLNKVLQLDLQNAASKAELNATMGPLRVEADRLQAMADIVRARIEGIQNMKELKELQETMAAEMGMQENPAVQATGQMPTAVAPQPPDQGPDPEPKAPQGPPPGPPPGPTGPPSGGSRPQMAKGLPAGLPGGAPPPSSPRP